VCSMDYRPAQCFRNVLYIHLKIRKTNSFHLIRCVGQLIDMKLVINSVNRCLECRMGRCQFGDLGLDRRIILKLRIKK
jgi:hypothetical protein